MRPTLQPTVPSRRLLRFLKSQSEGIPFFVPHHQHPQHIHTSAIVVQAAEKCRDQSRRLQPDYGAVPIAAVANCASQLKPQARAFSSSGPRRPDTSLSSRAFSPESILLRHSKRIRASNPSLTSTNNAAVSRRLISSEDTDDGLRKKTSSERLWGPNAVKPDFQSHSTEELEDSIFTSSMGRRAKAALEPVLRCTEVDEKGDAILTDGAFKKTELIAKVSCQYSLQRPNTVSTKSLIAVKCCSMA